MSRGQTKLIQDLRIELEESQATVRVLSDRNAELQADTLKATDAAQDALAHQAQELARLGAEVQAGEEALLAERRRVAELEGEVAASESALHIIEDRLRDAGVDSVEGLHDLALKATERAEAAQARVAELERDAGLALARAAGFANKLEAALDRAEKAEAALATSEGHAIASREALEEVSEADEHANNCDTWANTSADMSGCNCFVRRVDAALASPSPQPTHWVPRAQVTKLEAEVAAMAPVVESARKWRSSDFILDAALAALDARKGGG